MFFVADGALLDKETSLIEDDNPVGLYHVRKSYSATRSNCFDRTRDATRTCETSASIETSAPEHPWLCFVKIMIYKTQFCCSGFLTC